MSGPRQARIWNTLTWSEKDKPKITVQPVEIQTIWFGEVLPYVRGLMTAAPGESLRSQWEGSSTPLPWSE
jgi:hypothetical protein